VIMYQDQSIADEFVVLLKCSLKFSK